MICQCPKHNSKPHIAVRARLVRDKSDARQLATADGARISLHSAAKIDSGQSDARRSDRANDVSQQRPPKGLVLGAGTGDPSNPLAGGYREVTVRAVMRRAMGFCGISAYYSCYFKNCNLPTPGPQPTCASCPIFESTGQRGEQNASHHHL